MAVVGFLFRVTGSERHALARDLSSVALAIGSFAVAAARVGGKADGVHHHRQFRRRTGIVPPLPARCEVPVRRTRRARIVPTGWPRPASSASRCDVLVISGHYGGGNEFFSDALEAREFLPVAELERVSCSGFLPEPVLAAEGGLPLRLQHAESGGATQRIAGDRAQPRARRALARGGRAARAIVECGARREQPRQDAAGVQGRSGDLRLFVGRRRWVRRLPPRSSRYFQATGAGEVGNGRASSRLLGQLRAQRDGGGPAA